MDKDCSMYTEHVESGKRKVTLSMTVNGRPVVRDVDPNMTLLHFLRDNLKLFGTKEACGEGECGACTIIMNGKAVTSCIILAVEAEGAQITTVEGLAKDGKLSILQEEFISQDALQCDDQRYFTVEVRPPWKVLIVAPKDSARKPADYALFLSQALAPHALRVKGEAAFECKVISSDALTDAKLEEFGAVCLVDPRPLEPGVWQRLHSYVSAGGGLGIFLGRNAAPVET